MSWSSIGALFVIMACSYWAGEHPEGGVPPGRVVEDLDVVEYLGAELLSLGPGAAVDEFLLERREEVSQAGVDGGF